MQLSSLLPAFLVALLCYAATPARATAILQRFEKRDNAWAIVHARDQRHVVCNGLDVWWHVIWAAPFTANDTDHAPCVNYTTGDLKTDVYKGAVLVNQGSLQMTLGRRESTTVVKIGCLQDVGTDKTDDTQQLYCCLSEAQYAVVGADPISNATSWGHCRIKEW